MPIGPKGDCALRVVGVDHAYRGHLVLSGVGFEVSRGDVLCILGPSGCGKTTLLRIIAGLLTPKHGSVWINGQLQDGVPPNRRNLGFVFQQPTLFPTRDVYENVAFPFRRGGKPVPSVYGTASRAVDEILSRTGLSGLERQSVATLSGGQKQRVALARALVYQPTLLLLDEPLSSVDNALRGELLALLLELHDQFETTMVYVTHDEREALRVATHLVALDRHGQLLQHSTASDVMTAPDYSVVARLTDGWNLFTVQSAGNERFDIVSNPTESWARFEGGRLSKGSLVIGLPMSATCLQPSGISSSTADLLLKVVIRRRVPWHNGWRYECEAQSLGDKKPLLVCFGERNSVIEVGTEGVVTFNKEDIRVFKDQSADDDTATSASVGS